MLSRIFDADNVVFRFFRTVGNIWWLHILWLVCSIPIITIGASTTALCYSSMKLRRQEGYITSNFFKSFKENFAQSTILFLIYTVALALLLADIVLGNQMGTQLGKALKYGSIAILVPYILSAVYVYAVQSRFVNPIGKTIQYSFMIALTHLKETIQIVILVGLVIWLNTTIVLFNFITITIGIGILFYFLSAYYNRVFSKYIDDSKEELVGESYLDQLERQIEEEKQEKG